MLPSAPGVAVITSWFGTTTVAASTAGPWRAGKGRWPTQPTRSQTSQHGASGRERVADSGMGRDESSTCVRAARRRPGVEHALAGSHGDPTPPEGYTATRSFIPSFGAFT